MPSTAQELFPQRGLEIKKNQHVHEPPICYIPGFIKEMREDKPGIEVENRLGQLPNKVLPQMRNESMQRVYN